MRIHAFAVSLAFVGGCSTTDPHVDVADNALHVAYVSFDRSGDLVTMTGFARDDRQVGFASLRIGEVKYSWDGDGPQDTARGSELVVSVGDDRIAIVTPDLTRHVQQQFDKRSLDAFVNLDPVRAELASAGIELSTEPSFGVPPDGESAYYWAMTGQDCDARLFPNNKPPAQQCAQSVSGSMITYHSNDPAINISAIFRRAYIGHVCRQANGTTGCGNPGSGNVCTYGPCGGQNQSTSYGYIEHYPGSSDVTIDPNTNNSWFWTSYDNSCTCTGCNTDGHPTPAGCTNAFGD